MGEYTKGPWELTEHEDHEGGNPWYRITGESTLFLDVVECSDGYVPGQNKANARLIAAAPELLDACQVARRAFAELNGDVSREVWERLYEVTRTLDAAISKTTN